MEQGQHVSDQLGLFGPVEAPQEIRIREVTAYQIILSAAGREYFITSRTSEPLARQHAAQMQARHPTSNYFVRAVTQRLAG
jgi:hypothetical protein